MPPVNNDKRKKKHYYQSCSKKTRYGVLEAGVHGVLITCNGNEKRCVSEAYNLLNEYADTLYGPEFKASDEASSTVSIEDQLQQELDELKSKKNTRRFQNVTVKVKNNVFIQTMVPDVSELVSTIFKDIILKGQRKTRFIMKMIPVLSTCKCLPEAVRNCVSDVIGKQYPDDNDSVLSYKVQCKVRYNTNIDKANLIWCTREAVSKTKPTWSATVDNPDIIIALNILQVVCCVSVLKNYDMYKGYNLAEIVPVKADASESKVNSDCSQPAVDEIVIVGSSVNKDSANVDSDASVGADVNVVQQDSTTTAVDEIVIVGSSINKDSANVDSDASVGADVNVVQQDSTTTAVDESVVVCSSINKDSAKVDSDASVGADVNVVQQDTTIQKDNETDIDIFP